MRILLGMIHWKPALLGLFAFCAAVCFAQFETSEVLGTVRDASQKAMAKAMVTLTNQDTGIAAKTTTDESGNYDFFNVKVGRYTITVEMAGFSKFSSADMVVNVNARQRVDAALQVGVGDRNGDRNRPGQRGGNRYQRTQPGDRHSRRSWNCR